MLFPPIPLVWHFSEERPKIECPTEAAVELDGGAGVGVIVPAAAQAGADYASMVNINLSYSKQPIQPEVAYCAGVAAWPGSP
jgi:hypothetical protein